MSNRTLCLMAAAALSLAAVGGMGCKKSKPDTRPKFDADARSGLDGKRSGAITIEVNKVVTDDVNFDGQDQTDWKQVELKGKPGILTVELHWDRAEADLNCDVFNSFGEQIAASPGPQAGAQQKKVIVEVSNLGVYFLRIQAAKRGDYSVYTLEAKWDGEVAPPPTPPPVETPKEPVGKKPIVKRTSSAPKERKFDPDRGVQGRIVSSYREGGQLVLHIDKGSAAGVKVGNSGAVLDGPQGSNRLEGGDFSIVQVIDESKSVAKTGLK